MVGLESLRRVQKKPLGKEGEALFAVEIPGLKRLGREAETCHHVAVVVPEKRRPLVKEQPQLQGRPQHVGDAGAVGRSPRTATADQA